MMQSLDAQNLPPLGEAALAVVVIVLLGVALLLGLAVWLLGWRLARPACVVSGLVLGGLGGFTLGEMLGSGSITTIPLVVGAGIAGGLLAAMLFRVWMALSAAILLALVAPAAVVIWQGTPSEAPGETTTAQTEREHPGSSFAPSRSPESGQTRDPDAPGSTRRSEPIGEGPSWQEIAEAVRERIEEEIVDQTEPTSNGQGGSDNEAQGADRGAPGNSTANDTTVGTEDASQPQINAALGEARAAARSWYSRTRDQLAAWWGELDGAARRMVFTAAGVGALLGLVLGLVMPYTAAAVQSALVGSLLMLVGGRELVERLAPGWAEAFPYTPRAMLIWLGLITLLGVLLQWTFFHKRTDK